MSSVEARMVNFPFTPSLRHSCQPWLWAPWHEQGKSRWLTRAFGGVRLSSGRVGTPPSKRDETVRRASPLVESIHTASAFSVRWYAVSI